MTFVAAVESSPSIRTHLKSGLKALKKVDRGRVSCDGRRLRGSVDIDGALRLLHPNVARWDYVVGYGGTRGQESVIWLEVHPASSHHIDEVLDKLRWLKLWIRNEAPGFGGLPRCFCWIASGAISLNRGSPQARKFAEAGLNFPVKHADLERLFE